MDFYNTFIEWVKAEILSSLFFLLFGIVLFLLSFGFVQFGKTIFAKAYIVPVIVIGVLSIIIGIGLFSANVYRYKTINNRLNENPTELIQQEKLRAQNTIKDFENVVFKVIPLLIIVSSILIVLSNNPTIKTSAIVSIFLLSTIIFIDSNSYARMKDYYNKLQQITTLNIK